MLARRKQGIYPKVAVLPRQHILVVARTEYIALDSEDTGSRKLKDKFG